MAESKKEQSASHLKGLRRLGGLLHNITSGSTPLESGTALDKCIKAGVKAINPGRQTDKQVNEQMKKFRQAFVRQLAEETASGALEDDSGTV
jgi:hypothetical protein